MGLGGNLSLFTSEDVNFPRLQLLCFTAKMAPEGLETDTARRQEGHEQGPDTVLEARQTQTQGLCSEGIARGMPFAGCVGPAAVPVAAGLSLYSKARLQKKGTIHLVHNFMSGHTLPDGAMLTPERPVQVEELPPRAGPGWFPLAVCC